MAAAIRTAPDDTRLDAHPVGSRAARQPSWDLTTEDVLADLEVGRSRPLVPADGLAAPVRRPALGGAAFTATWSAVQALGRIDSRLARPALEALWFTPWTVGRERRLPEGAVRRTFRTGGYGLQGWEVGSGPTVLLVHGWGGRSTDLATVAADVAAAGFRAVAVDLPAHGRSPGRRTHRPELAGAVRGGGVLVGPLHGVVTHSLGGAATVLALREGLATERLVLLAPPRRLEHAVARFGDAAKLPDGVEDELRALLEQRFGATIWEDLAVDALLPGAGLGRAAVDALVVHDGDDEEISVEDGRFVADVLGAEFVETSGLGHGRILVDADVRSRAVAHLRR